MVHIHSFRSAFQASTREHRLLGMAGETPFANAAELNAEGARVEASLRTDHDATVEAEARVTKIRLELTEARDPALAVAARAMLDRITAAERARRDSRAEVTAENTRQTAKRAEILGKLNVAATRAAGLTDARTEINASLDQIKLMSDPATPEGQKFARADLITAHLAHIRQLQDIAPTTPPLNPNERALLRSAVAAETAGDDGSKNRLGGAYLKAEGYEEVAPVAPATRKLTYSKVYPGVVPAAKRTLSLEYQLHPAPAPQMWKVTGTVGGIAIPLTNVTAFNGALIDGLVAADPQVNAIFHSAVAPAPGSGREDMIRQLAIADNLANGVQTAADPLKLAAVKNKAMEAETRNADTELATLTAAHPTFINGPFTTAFLLADTAKREGTTAGLAPDIIRARIITALDAVPAGLRKVAADRKAALDVLVKDKAALGANVPPNIVAQITELRRQIADIDVQLRAKTNALGITTTAPVAPAETPEARIFKTAVDAAINLLSATSTRAQLDTAQTALGAALTALPVAQRAANLNYIVTKAREKGLTAVITGLNVRLTVGVAPLTTPDSGPDSLGEVSARVRPFLEFLRMLAPVLGALNPNFNAAALEGAINRVDLNMQLRAAEAELTAFDRANPAPLGTAELRARRTAIETRIRDLRARIARLPAIPPTTPGGFGTVSEAPEAMINAFAAQAAIRINTFLAPGTTTVVNNNVILINCNGRPAPIIGRLNVLMGRFGAARVGADRLAGVPPATLTLLGQANSNVVALDARMVFQMVGGDVNNILSSGGTFVPPVAPYGAPYSMPPYGVPYAPVAGPIASANATAINGPKPGFGATSRRTGV